LKWKVEVEVPYRRSTSQLNPREARQSVLYDGDCPLCIFQMKMLTWLDWFDQTALRPISDPEAAAVGAAPGEGGSP